MHPLSPAVLSVAISLATQRHAVPTEGKALVCDLSPKAECVLDLAREIKRGPFVREVEKRNEERLGTELVAVASPDFSHLLIVGVHREPGNVCI